MNANIKRLGELTCDESNASWRRSILKLAYDKPQQQNKCLVI